MLVQVRLLKGFNKPLFYKVPDSWAKLSEGKIINVPIKNNVSPAIVIKTYLSQPEKFNFELRLAHSIEPFPDDLHYQKFIKKASWLYLMEELYFYQRIRQFLNHKGPTKPYLQTKNLSAKQTVILTPEQEKITTNLKQYIKKSKYMPTLLHGVTSSGKTEVYVKLILECIKENKTSVLLLPEVSLAMQFEAILKRKIHSAPILGFHSASRVSEKKLLWQLLLQKKPVVIVGVHLPVLLPIPNLGLIIVDEEHEVNFQEKKHPRLNSKELALLKASICKIPILLGSATPSVSSLYNVKKKGWSFFQLKKRFAGNFPKVETTPLSRGRRESFWITKVLKDAIRETLNKKEQVLIFLNRRGYSFFVMCKECSFVFECPNCSVSLTLHQGELLKCHYCTYIKTLSNCPKCQLPKEKLMKKGIGTQQVVTILEKLFPTARIRRADLDTTIKKREWQDTVKLCEEGKVDILIGTQTITKGYHFPKVTLVGVLWADMSLHFPIYNAGEVTLQQLLQVAGRAGRETSHSKVILQVMNDHPIFEFLNEKDYLKFYKQEMEFRTLVNYPPVCRLMHIELKNSNPIILDKETDTLFRKLEKNKGTAVTILGPVKPAIHKIQKSEVRHIYFKSSSFKEILNLIQKEDLNTFKSSIFVVPSS